MKKIILFSVLFLPFYASAQFNKGDVFLGGNLSTSLQNSSYTGSPQKEKNNSFSLAPSSGYFLNEKSAVGITIGFSTSTQEVDYPNTPAQKYKSNSFSFGLFHRYYFPLSEKVYITIHSQLGFSRGSNETINYNTSQSSSNYSLYINARPIFVFFPSPKWGIEAGIGSLGYSYNRTLPNANHTNSFGLSAGSFTFGIAYYFRKK